MICKRCGAENSDVKRTCCECGAFLEGYTLNNITGEYGYRGGDGVFYKNEEEYRSHSSSAGSQKGVPIRSFTSSSPLAKEVRESVEKFMSEIGHDVRFFSDDAIIKAFAPIIYPKGTDVIVYCHDEDRENVTKEIEKTGCKIAAFCELPEYLKTFVGKGKYIYMKKRPHYWNPRKDSAIQARLDFSSRIITSSNPTEKNNWLYRNFLK